MNYCVVAFATITLISALAWIFEGRGQYKGPQIDKAALRQGEVTGMAVEDEKKIDSPES